MSYGDSENAMLIQDQIKAAIQERDECNGWKNYPTWAVRLWLSNDEDLHNEVQNMAGIARDMDNDSGVLTDDEHTRNELADMLLTWVCDDLLPDLGASFSADLLGWAVAQVEWDDIAAAWLED